MWVQKYRPEGSLDTYFGNRRNVRISVNWINSVIRGNPIDEGLLYYGPPGTGKTSLAQVLSDVFDIPFAQSNASDERNKEDINKVVSRGSSSGLTKSKTFVVLDEVESVNCDLTDVIENTNCILITNEKYELNKDVRNSLINLEFDYPKDSEKKKYIQYILEQEGIKLDKEKIQNIVDKSRTFRSVAKNTQLACVSGVTDFVEEKTDYGMYEELERIFAGKDVGRADMKPRDILKWAMDNEANPAFISVLDKLLGKTPPNDYRSWRYVYDLIHYAKPSIDVEYPNFFKLLAKHKSENGENSAQNSE